MDTDADRPEPDDRARSLQQSQQMESLAIQLRPSTADQDQDAAKVARLGNASTEAPAKGNGLTDLRHYVVPLPRRLAPLASVAVLTLASWRLAEWASTPIHRMGMDDFLAFYAGAQQLLAGRSPYSTPFVSPPFYALLVAPFTAFSYETAANLWFAMNLLLSLGATALCLSLIGWRSPILILMASALFILWPPNSFGIALGQNSALVFFAVVSALLLMRRGNDRLAGVLFAVAASKPQLVLPLLGGLALWRWRSTRSVWLPISFLITVSAGTLLTALLSPEWLGDVMGLKVRSWNYWGSVVSLNTLIADLFTHDRRLAPVIYLPALLLGLGALAHLWWRHNGDLLLPVSITLSATLLITPYSYPHDYVLLLLPLIVIFRYAAALPPIPMIASVAALSTLTWVLPQSGIYEPSRHLTYALPLSLCAILLILYDRGLRARFLQLPDPTVGSTADQP